MLSMSKTTTPIVLVPEEQATLDAWARARNLSYRKVIRARIITMAADGVLNQDIGNFLSVSRPIIQLWRERFLALRLVGLGKDAPRPGRKPKVSARKIQAMVEATLHSPVPNATHWNTRSMAKARGLSKATVYRIWKQHHLKPHLVKTFKLSRDKHSVEKVHDV